MLRSRPPSRRRRFGETTPKPLRGGGGPKQGDPMIELSSPRHAHWRRQPFQAALLIGALATGLCLGAAVAHAYDNDSTKP
jgi:hypothetical protein